MSESALLCVLPCASCGAEARGGPPTPPDLAEILRRRGEGCCSLRCRAALVRQQQDGTLIDPVELLAREEAIAREIDPHAVWGEPAELRALWRRYWLRDDDATRSALVEAYMRLVRLSAEQTFGTLPPGSKVLLRDLQRAGAAALGHAVQTFDSHRGIEFSAFAAPRIQAAIADYLRSFDLPAPPSQETPIVPTLSDHASPANNGRLAAQTSATANPAPTAPSLIRLIANAGEEELQAIRDRIAEIRRELENLIAFEKTLASRLGKKTAGAVAEKLSDRIRQTIERNGPAKTAELAKAVNEAEGVVRATCKRTAGFRVASDLTVSLAKGGGR